MNTLHALKNLVAAIDNYNEVENMPILVVPEDAPAHQKQWRDAYTEAQECIEGCPDTNSISDGYHTFAELYDFRKVFNAALFNEWAANGKYNVHKSQHHSNGDACFGGGWFIVVAELPTGQISNHYEIKDWDLFKVPSVGIPVEFDGHTPKDVLQRLNAIL